MSSACTNPANPYIHWIHCNRCYETFIKKERSFFLLACQHVTCQQCLIEIEQDVNGPRVYKCTVCQKVTRAVEINNSMPTNLKELFHPEPYLDGLNNFKIIKFQAGHRRRYLQHLDRQAKQIKEIEKTTEIYKVTAKKTFQELHQAKIDRKQAAKRMLSIQQQRRDLDSNSYSKSHMTSSSSSTSSSLKSQKGRSIHGQMKDGITSFSELSTNNSFLL